MAEQQESVTLEMTSEEFEAMLRDMGFLIAYLQGAIDVVGIPFGYEKIEAHLESEIMKELWRRKSKSMS